MNKTKKRALLSAIAMLVVSAVVLSSATFAWFVAGDAANINTISANVATSSSIQVSADKDSWSATLNQSDMEAVPVGIVPDNSFPAMLTAISTPATASMPFFKGELLNTKAFTSSSASAGDIAASLVKFTFWIRSGADAAAAFTTSTLIGSAINATYVAIQIGDSGVDNAGTKTPTVFVGTANSYVPIIGAAAGTDTDGNGIMNGAGEFGSLGTTVTGTAFAGATQIALTSMTEKQIIVYMWLEGNDANCKLGTGGTSGSAALALNFVKV
jgi:hypothetical protein